jgi:hypothetical protein
MASCWHALLAVQLHSPAAGQDSMLKRLRGIVSDAEDQQLLVGVHVFARVAHTGAVSDDRGVFNLTVDPMDTLIITTVGYMRQIVPLAYFPGAANRFARSDGCGGH